MVRPDVRGGGEPSPSRRALRRSPRARVALGTGRAVGAASRRFGLGGGRQVSGRAMLGVDPRITERLAAGRTVVLVSATNGKTATTALLVAALRGAGRRVVTNDDGANLLTGLTAALASDRRAEVAVLEVDEAQLPGAVARTHPAVVVLGGLSRDQLDRHHEVWRVAERWRAAVPGSGAVIVATACDPNVVWAAGSDRTVWVDLGPSDSTDARACPSCGGLLDTRPGGWWCDCGFARPQASWARSAEGARVEGCDVPLQLGLQGSWQHANAVLALAAADQLGVPPAVAAEAMGSVRNVGRRATSVDLRGGPGVDVLLAKNPASWQVILDDLAGSRCGVVIAQNDDAADGRDPSWLWDVPFEQLGARPLAAAGSRCLDVAVRVASIGGSSLVVEPDPLRAARLLGVDRVVVGASYTAFRQLVAR